ncbi:MAG: AAA family ATPase, partial [Polyangiales bacterium]
MKIARLALAAFGPFTDTTLDFTGAPGALQVVYGPNEAGKSTTLRALTALLYGVPVRTGDAHVHDMTRLRVGATLLDADGNEVTVTRRKGAKSTLLDASNEPVDEAGLTRLLGGLDETLFRQMFGLDHVTLRAGGEALLAGEGQLGETLFSAASGARGVSQLIASLRAQLDGLYKARGKQPRLNQALERLHACERRTKDAMLSPQSYIDQKRALEEARIGRDRALVQRRALLSEQSQLGRRIAILPVLRRREELLRAPVTVAPTSGDEAALATLLVELTRRHAGVLAALEARPAQLAERALLERDVAELRARLGAAAAASALETPVRARLRKLADEARALAEEQRELTRALAEHEDDARPERAGDDDAQLSAQTLALLTERIELAERAGL